MKIVNNTPPETTVGGFMGVSEKGSAKEEKKQSYIDSGCRGCKRKCDVRFTKPEKGENYECKR